MEKILLDTKWLKVKQTPGGYIYSERRNINSLAVLLYRQKTDGTGIEILTRLQPLPIDDNQVNDDIDEIKLYRCPITGGLEEGYSTEHQAMVEIQEEAGYIVPIERLEYAGEYYVGTQTSEKVFMYSANIDGESVGFNISGDGSYLESISRNEWIDLNDLPDIRYAGLLILIQKLKEKLEKEQ